MVNIEPEKKSFFSVAEITDRVLQRNMPWIKGTVIDSREAIQACRVG